MRAPSSGGDDAEYSPMRGECQARVYDWWLRQARREGRLPGRVGRLQSAFQDAGESAPAIIAGATAIITATGALVQSLSSSGITGLFSGPKGPEWERVIDREYIAITAARVWFSQDIALRPVAELRQAGSFIVRGKVKGADLYLVEYAPGQVGYVVTQHLVESGEWRRRRDQQQQQEVTAPQQSDSVAVVKSAPSAAIEDWVGRNNEAYCAALRKMADYAEPVIGRRFAPTRWLIRPTGCYVLPSWVPRTNS